MLDARRLNSSGRNGVNADAESFQFERQRFASVPDPGARSDKPSRQCVRYHCYSTHGIWNSPIRKLAALY
ncbi:MAG: hypothetical protein ACREQO_19050, partial [Candidatus Binatia bacterium]